MGHVLRVGMWEVNCFPGEEARLALGQVERSLQASKGCPGGTLCIMEQKGVFQDWDRQA